MKKMNMSKVNPKLDWKDISNEKFRSYMFPVEGEFPFAEVKINEPLLLAVNYKSGGHKIIDKNSRSWYIPAGWLALFWEGYGEDSPTYMF